MNIITRLLFPLFPGASLTSTFWGGGDLSRCRCAEEEEPEEPCIIAEDSFTRGGNQPTLGPDWFSDDAQYQVKGNEGAKRTAGSGIAVHLTADLAPERGHYVEAVPNTDKPEFSFGSDPGKSIDLILDCEVTDPTTSPSVGNYHFARFWFDNPDREDAKPGNVPRPKPISTIASRTVGREHWSHPSSRARLPPRSALPDTSRQAGTVGESVTW